MNKGLVEGSNYRGEILMEFKVEKTDTKHTMKRLPINYGDDEKKADDDDDDEQKSQNIFPKMMNYYLRADLYEGTEINDIKGITTGEICVEVHVANCFGRSSTMMVKDDNVFIEWYETLSSKKISDKHSKNLDLNEMADFDKNEIKDHLIGPFKIPQNWRTDSSIPLPDVFIYLCAKELASKRMKQVSYYRVSLRQILSPSSGLFVSIKHNLFLRNLIIFCQISVSFAYSVFKVEWKCGEDRLFGMI